MSYLYYPGCALKATGKAYEESLLAVLDALEVPHPLLQDWNCCGATVYMSVDEGQAFALAARNLALAERQKPDASAPAELLTPCSACYLVMNKAQRYMEEYEETGRRIADALLAAGLSYQGRVRVRHPLDVIVNDVGLERIAARVQRPLTGLRVASYYGCLLVRPYATFDDPHDPTTMDRLMEAIGAEPVPWPLKTRCCGGSLTGTIEEIGLRLAYILLNEAKRRGALAVATACPFCQFNLECFQRRIRRRYRGLRQLPVVFFTQLLGLALGIPKQRLGLQRLLVPLEPVMTAIEGAPHARA